MTTLGSAFAAAVLALMLSAPAAHAQTFNPQRDCQTLLKCQYARGASFRGCISTYSCRVCRLVTASCSDRVGRSACRRMQCSWG